MNIYINISITYIIYNNNMATTTTTTTIYKKCDFERIQYEGFSYTLSPDVLKIIQSIADQVGSPEYVKTPQFEKRQPAITQLNNPMITNIGHNHSHSHNNNNHNKRYDNNNSNNNNNNNSNNNNNNNSNNKKRDKYSYNNNNKGQEITDDDWEAIRKFQATVLAKKEGIDASIETIRVHLNKITDKTYETLKVLIVEEINKIISANSSANANANANEVGVGVVGANEVGLVETPELLLELKKIGDAIFNIASSNGFYSKVYATLYKDLMSQFKFMRGIFETNYKGFNSVLFKTIEYYDPNKDYDKFCQMNKDNEKRRSMCSFYINLMLQGIIAPKSILKIILGLQDLMLEKIKVADATNIVEELSEVLFILITSSAEMFKRVVSNPNNKESATNSSDSSSDDETLVVDTYVSPTKWEKIVSNVNYISKLKQKSFPSISNKTIFKHMDIIDDADI